jgi:small GTP-binding protein
MTFTAILDDEHLQNALHQLNELFMLVFVGEFNSGKSALINALLGEAFLTEGVTPTTDRIHIIKYGEAGPPEFAGDDVRILRFPSEVLREIHVVDTPGTNAVLRRHEAIAKDFVPRSDMVIFVTSADRPFTESEKEFLESIQAWGKKVVVVINKIDILDDPRALEEVTQFVRDQVRRLLGFNPDLFPLSARQARMHPDDPPLGFGEFQSYLRDTLTQENVIRLKLLNPLGVARKVAREDREKAEARLSVVREDTKVLLLVDRQLELYQSDTRAEYSNHWARIENELLEMQLRGEKFLDDHMRILNLREMLQTQLMRTAFEKAVIDETPEKIEQQITEVIDWLVERELRQWRLMSDELSRRKDTELLQEAARQAAGGFAYNRRQLIDSVGAQADQVIGGFDKRAESKRLADAIQESIALVGLVEVGAISLGLVLNALLATAAADLTGILAAGILGVLGLAIIPYRRGVAKKELRKKMDDLRQSLSTALSDSFDREIERSVSRLTEAIAPYRRFVLSEESRLLQIRGAIEAVEMELSEIASQLET